MGSSRTQVNVPLDDAPDSVRTSEVPAWNDRNFLSLDGGGVRGYWSLLVLDKLMRGVGVEERLQAGASSHALHSFLPQDLPPNYTQCEKTMPDNCEEPGDYDAQRFLPCHYFDLICGSSTGSLIAIMLSRFRMTVQDCLEEYKTMSSVIFGNPRLIAQRRIGIVKRSKYSATVMENAFKDVTDRRDERLQGTEKPAPSQIGTHVGTCQMFATTLRRVENPRVGSAETTHLLRSYVHKEKKQSGWPINYDTTRAGVKFEVCLVARAATAAPMYFKEVVISTDDGGKICYSDGGFGRTNNPTELGKYEVEHYWYSPDTDQDGKIGVVVSIGTARRKFKPGGRGLLQRIKQAFSTATDPQSVADYMTSLRLPHYWRLNDAEGLKMELDDWKPKNSGARTIAYMEREFARWWLDKGNQKMIRDCARELVKRRRLRTEDRNRWDRFASVAEYTCKCGNREPFPFRDDFNAHYREGHEPRNHISCREPEVKLWEYPGRPNSASAQNGFTRRFTGRSGVNQ